MIRKKKITILVCFLLVVCLLLIVDKSLQMISCGFTVQYQESPNGQYEAYVNTMVRLNLFGKVKRYNEFSIYDVSNKVKDKPFNYKENLIKHILLYGLPQENYFDMISSEKKIINWSPDSSEVKCALEDIEIKLKINENKEK